jgi:uncharacterized metal-binding protein
MSDKIKVIPCSGMGKVFGLISRETALAVANKLAPDKSETMCLAYIVTGDKEAKEQIEGKNCITLDGCPQMCAAKNVAIAGGIVKEKIRVVDAFKSHRGVKAGNATELTQDGWVIVDELAEKVVGKIKEIGEEK